ncbi:glycine-rich domain-containing protein [Kibdelosporangium lantanae]|uniref:Glycine-rich domain-containing protein n=1 Tax=Kibdelosporangium lantanae TaxID=1497396 RepID=A0ABW3M3A7_9PSEU
MTTAQVVLRDPRTCVSPEVWEREVRLIMRDHSMNRELAERTFGQTVAYLVTTAANPSLPMGPTPAVDKGVHSFLLDTPRYWDFCMHHAGTYLHHVPHLPEERATQPKVLQQTIQAIRATGFVLDNELWGALDVDCHQCHACCADSPGGK